MNFYGNYILQEDRIRELEQNTKHRHNRRNKPLHHKLMHNTGRFLIHVGQTMQDMANS